MFKLTIKVLPSQSFKKKTIQLKRNLTVSFINVANGSYMHLVCLAQLTLIQKVRLCATI